MGLFLPISSIAAWLAKRPRTACSASITCHWRTTSPLDGNWVFIQTDYLPCISTNTSVYRDFERRVKFDGRLCGVEYGWNIHRQAGKSRLKGAGGAGDRHAPANVGSFQPERYRRSRSSDRSRHRIERAEGEHGRRDLPRARGSGEMLRAIAS